MFFGKKELTYTAGKLGRKLGVCGRTIKSRLEKSGLMKDCYKDENGWLQIPYSVAVQLSSESALAVEMPKAKRSKRKRKSATKAVAEEGELDLVELGLMPPKTKEDYFPAARKRKETADQVAIQKFHSQREYCRTLACLLSQMGVTPQMYMEAYQKQKEQTNEAEEPEPLQTTEG